jgi:predicted acyltransferase
MVWIMGADQVIRALAANSQNPVLRALGDQFEHVPWDGFHFYDGIFPVFLFLIGCSIPFAFARRLERGESKPALYRHVLLRFLVMLLFGMMINGNLLTYDPTRFQLTYSVLQVLATGYLCASILYLNLAPRALVLTTAGLLIGYWALMTFVPVPGHAVGVYKPGANFGDWLNDRILGDFQGPWRFGWILQTMTYASNALLGVFAGLILRSPDTPRRKLARLVSAGAGCVAAGLLWSLQFPIIKDRWTSTFVLFTCGCGYLLLALFYGIIDVRGHRAWAFPFVVIGSNALFTYMVWGLASPAFRRASEVFTRGLQPYAGGWYEAIAWSGAMLLMWLLLYYLYRNKTFVKI